MLSAMVALFAGPSGGGPIPPGLACAPDATTLCLGGGRFAVTVDWEDAAMVGGQGQVFPTGSDDWGVFFYDAARYLELMVKVLDLCAVNNHFAVFVAGLADDEQTITVRDTFTGLEVGYFNALGNFDVAVQDAAALPCTIESGRTGGERWIPVKGTPPEPPTMTLADGRIEVLVEWTADSSTGFGMPVGLTSHSGYFWFFSESSPELIVQVFDGEAENGFFHFFAGDLTDVEYAIRVVDTCTGASKTYDGLSNITVDETAFPVAQDSCVIFSTGFETGDFSAWSGVNGG